jgi:2Fe-2S ferredoxin
MAKIVIENLFGKSLELKDTQKTFLQHFHEHQLDWMHACGGKGRCTTCKIVIEEGGEISPLTQPELRYIRIRALQSRERLSCQAIPSGDVRIRVPEECKLPHVLYSD